MRYRHRTALLIAALLAALATAAPGASPAFDPQGPPARPNIVTGNGFLLGQIVEADGHTPVAGAVVQLTVSTIPDGAQGMPFGTQPNTLNSRTVATNGTGYFLFRGLGKGSYSIAVTAIGHVPGGYGQLKPTGATHPIELGENEQRTGVVITLWKYGSISGTVLDDAGEPAIGTQVTVFSSRAGIDQLTLSPQTSVFTDDRGVYRFGSLTPGAYVVGLVTGSMTLPASLAAEIEASAADPQQSFNITTRFFAEGSVSLPSSGSGIRIGDVVVQRLTDAAGGLPPPDERGRMMTYATTFYPGTPQWRQAQPINLAPGEAHTGVDLILKLVAGVRVSGIATGPKGPMKDLVVHLSSAVNGPLTSLEPIDGADAFADANGAFEFFGIAPGQYTIRAARSPIDSNQANRDDWSWTSETISVGSSDVTGVALTLRPGVKVSGRFELVGSKPRPEGPVSVLMLRPIGAQSWRTGRALPSPDGTFSTQGDPGGRYFVVVVEPAGWFLKSVTHDGKNITDEPIDVGPNDLTGVVVTLIDKTTHVRGAITDANGAPDTQADVLVFPADSKTWRDGIYSSRRVRQVSATLAGTYQLDNLPAGEYYIAAVDTRLTANWKDPGFLDRLTSAATHITLADGEEKTVSLKRVTVRDK
jgi:hypothetical protein